MRDGFTNGGNTRDDMLFRHVLLMLQTLALQQLGKITNPITGKVERELHQARITIDMLGMLQRKTAGNLGENEKRLLDTVVLELQMNYVDESGRSDSEENAGEAAQDDEPSGGDHPGGDVSDGSGPGTEEPDRNDIR